MTGIVDRTEGIMAVIEQEDGVFINVPLSRFEVPIREGDQVDLESYEILASDFDKDDLTHINQYFND